MLILLIALIGHIWNSIKQPNINFYRRRKIIYYELQ